MAHLSEGAGLGAGTFVSTPKFHLLNRTQPENQLHCMGERSKEMKLLDALRAMAHSALPSSS